MSDREAWIKTGDIDFNEFNPNQMSPEKRAALKESIQKDGVQQNVIVRPKGNRFEMIDGQNRAEIAGELKIDKLKATIKDISDLDAMRLCYKLNAERGQLDAFKEAVFFDLLAQKGMLLPSVASEYKVSEQFIKDRIKLLSINTEQKELLLKKIGKNTELTGAHWLAYAKASPEARIEAAKYIRKDESLTVRDIEHNVNRAEREIKERKEFEGILERAEFKTCPKCKGKATGLDYKKHLKCAQYHDWDPKTGKSGQEIIGSRYTSTEKKKKPKFPRNLEIEIDWKQATDIAQKLALDNLATIERITFKDKKGKLWSMEIDRSKGFEGIKVQQDHGHEYDLSMRDPRGSGKRRAYVRGPQYADIGEKEHKEMLAWTKLFKGKVTDKRITGKKKESGAKKKGSKAKKAEK